MKKLALVAAFAFLTAVSASAAEAPKAAPAPTLEQLIGVSTPQLEAGIKPLPPYCSTLDGTSCPASGATTPCTDVCHNQLSCTCNNIYAPPYYIIVIGHYWHCNQEC